MIKIISNKRYNEMAKKIETLTKLNADLGHKNIDLEQRIDKLTLKHINLRNDYEALKAEHERWTDRDANGRFVKKEKR